MPLHVPHPSHSPCGWAKFFSILPQISHHMLHGAEDQNKTSSVNHRHVGCAGSLKIKLQCTRAGWGLERMIRMVVKTGPQPSAPQLTAQLGCLELVT